jgi:hypothetical protein
MTPEPGRTFLLIKARSRHRRLLNPRRLNLTQDLRRIDPDSGANLQKLHHIEPSLTALVLRNKRLGATQAVSYIQLGQSSY